MWSFNTGKGFQRNNSTIIRSRRKRDRGTVLQIQENESLWSVTSEITTDYVPNIHMVNLQQDEKVSKTQKLHQASLSGDEEEVRKLLTKGVDVNLCDSFGKTPLHNAINGKHINIVNLLLKSGADVRSLDERGDTPLHEAVRTGDEKIVEAITSNKRCVIDAKGQTAYTALHIAAQLDNVGICKKLVELGSEITTAGEDKMTPLAVAVAKGASEVGQYLLQEVQAKKLDKDKLFYNADNEGSTLLHLAVDSGILSIVALCLQSGCRIQQTKESDGTTAFHVACAQGSIEIIQLLVNENNELCNNGDLQDTQGMTPLHHAAVFGNTPIVTYLIEQGAPVNPRDSNSRTPLFLASNSGFNDTVQVLLDKGADVSLTDTEARSALHAAVGHASAMETLCKSPQSKALIVKNDVTGYSPVHYAARAGHVKNILLFLSKNKAAKTETSAHLDTPLHIGAKYGWLAIVQMLLKKRNPRLINAQNNQGRTALHLAAGEGHDDIAEFLLMEGATIERDRSERTPLHLAALNGSDTCIEYILVSHPDCLNAVDKIQNTAINLAAMSGHSEIVSRLLSVPEQRILLNKYNFTFLDLAINADKHEVAMAIAEHERWKEVILVSPGGGVAQLQNLVNNMPDVAEKILDQCVTTEGDPSSQDYKITYDLGLIQGKYSSDQKLTETMTALRTMAEGRRENCLTHPVCFFLMKLKWKKFGWLTFSANLSLYLAFLLSFTFLVVYVKSNDEQFCGFRVNQSKICGSRLIVKGKPNPKLIEYTKLQSYTSTAFHTLVIILAVFHLTKEVLQIYRLRFKYLVDFTNYIEWAIYICALIYVVPSNKMCKHDTLPEAAAFSLFLGWLNLILYFRRMSFYGKYVIMLTTMFKTLLQVMLLFGLFLMAFGTTFFILLDHKPAHSTLWYSIMKTFAMTLGELNYEDTFIPSSKLHYAAAMNILFLLFCLGMPIILMNMLVGLAVGDIDKIQQKSKMDRYVMQVEMLIEVEESLPSFILRRVQVIEHEQYPNRNPSLRDKAVDMIQGFGEPENTGEDSSLPPALAQFVDRIEDHENKLDEMYALMKQQTVLLKALGRRDGIDTEGGGTLKKGIVDWFKRR